MKYKFLAVWAIAAVLSGCYDDKGNYAYSEINEISIDTVGKQTEFEVYQFDVLDIPVDIRFAFEEVPDEDMEYKWTIYSNAATGNVAAEVIGTERNLHSVIRQPSSADSYSVVLQARNKRSGIATQMSYTVYVTSRILSGWVVLHTDGVQSDVDYIATPRAVPAITASRHIRNAYFTANNQKIPGTPAFVGAVRVNHQTVNSVYIGTREDLYKVSGKTFELEYLSESMFPVKPAVYDFQRFLSLSRSSNTQFVINNGQVHNIAGQTAFEITFSQALEANEALNAVDLAPFIYIPANFASTTKFEAVFYDRLGQRFVIRPQNNMPVAKLAPFTSQASSVFDVNYVGMDILWFERGYQDYGYAVFEDNLGGRWFYIADFNKAMDATMAVKKCDMGGCPEITDARFYSTGSRGPVFLYATERNIYTYDYNGSNQAVLINEPFGENEVITAMQVYKPYATTNDLANADGTLLYVATWDGQEGRLYEFSLNETNGYLREKKPLEVFGGMGRIVDFCFKVQGVGTGS